MATHRFTPATFHNVLGTLPPAFGVADGDTVNTETIDAHGHDKDRVRRAAGPNPMNGPIFVEGAEPGDALRVDIVRMTPISASGFTSSVVAANVVDPQAARELPPREYATWLISTARW